MQRSGCLHTPLEPHRFGHSSSERLRAVGPHCPFCRTVLDPTAEGGWAAPAFLAREARDAKGRGSPGTNLRVDPSQDIPPSSVPSLPQAQEQSPGAAACRLGKGWASGAPRSKGSQPPPPKSSPGAVPVSSNQAWSFLLPDLLFKASSTATGPKASQAAEASQEPPPLLGSGAAAFHASACALIRHGINRKPPVGSRGPFELSALLLAGTEAPEAVPVSQWIRTVASSPRGAKGVFSSTWNCLRCVGLNL